MKLRTLPALLFVVCALALAPAVSAATNSWGDFFKKIGDAFSHPRKHPTPVSHSKATTEKHPETALNPTPTPAANPEPTIRVATIVTEKNSQRDLPYGIPVADKPGFVTSPYSPTQGYVDVRGIPSGTEVKDPFTGKVFRTP